MRRLLSSIIALSAVFTFGYSQADFAGFEIDAPDTANTNEAIDITVKALDEDGNIFKDYAGTMYFDVIGDDDALMPNILDGYTFTGSDEGVHTFSKAITFKNPGVVTVLVVDIDDDLGSVVEKEITVVDGNDRDPEAIDIQIISPTNGTVLTENKTLLKGITKESTAVNIYLNDSKVGETQSDEGGKFQMQLNNLRSGKNNMKADALNSDGEIAGESNVVEVTVESEVPEFEKIDIPEGTPTDGPGEQPEGTPTDKTVHVGVPITLVAYADPALADVILTLEGKQVVLTETAEAGVYEGKSVAPITVDKFPIDIYLKDDLGRTFEQNAAAFLTTIPGKIENVEIQTSTKKVKMCFTVDPDIDVLRTFEITWGTDGDNLINRQITLEKEEILTEGRYCWYIPDVEVGEHVTKIIGLDQDQNRLPIESDLHDFVVDLNAATICFIERVSGLQVHKSKESSLISWDDLPSADKYLVYKKDGSGRFVKIDETRTNEYLVPITGKEIRYEDFAIRATCNEGGVTGEGDLSDAVSVQTGPELLILILFVLIGLSGYTFYSMRTGRLD